jgi:hypothetical protein
MHVVTLETYGKYDEETDTQYMKEFNICVDWLTEYLKEDGWTLSEFLSEYTWDNSEIVFMKAEALGIPVEVLSNKL